MTIVVMRNPKGKRNKEATEKENRRIARSHPGGICKKTGRHRKKLLTKDDAHKSPSD